MKKILILIFLLPTIVLGKTYNINDVNTEYLNEFINYKSNLLNNYNYYNLFFENNISLLSNEEYLAIGDNDNKSYLFSANPYFLLDNSTIALTNSSQDDYAEIRLTDYVATGATVTGKGTYNDPWKFKINLNCNEDDLVFHYGDVNMDGQITTDDASLILENVVSITTIPQLLSDVDNNGVVDSTDAAMVYRYIAGTSNSDSIVGNEFNATCGDVDLSNTLSYSDYELLINYISNNYELSNAQIKIADVNNDGVTDENDALTLQYYFQNNN